MQWPYRITLAVPWTFVVLFPAQAVAQSSDAQLDTVVVTATRFAEATPRTPANVSVITRNDIRNNANLALPNLLQQNAGAEVRGLYGTLGIDSTIDLRGFGENAGSNTLILLDGQRLNPIDSGTINWSTIPRESVERVEVMRGGGTVLYGDRATGGVINIITDKSGRNRLSAEAGLGSYGYRGTEAYVAGGHGGLYFNLFGQYRESAGYRENNQQDQQALSGRFGYALANGGEVFLDFAGYADSNGLPGSLFRAQYDADPSRARTPFDTQRRDGYRLRPGMAWQLAPALRLEMELSADHATLRTDSPSGSFLEDRERDLASFTPRVRWSHGFGRLRSETVLGADLYDGETEARSTSGFLGSNRQRAEQRSTAFYLQNTTDLTAGLALTIGGRTQRVRQETSDEAAALRGETTRSQNAGELGLSWQVLERLRIFARTGRVFRFANTDELFGFDPVFFVPVFRGDLRPQRGTDSEFGGDWTLGPARLQATLYRLELRDEIGFNSSTFINDNLPRTRRDGLELEAQWKISNQWRLRASYTHQDAKFREGPDAGKTIPLTARDKGSAGVLWAGGPWGTHSLAATYVGKRWYAGDTANVREQLPAYTVADYQASWDFRPWTLTLKVLNAFDKRYAPFAGYSTFFNDYFYFPADRRSIFVTARYDFKK